MQKFLRNLVTSTLVFICGTILYQAGSNVYAQSPSISLLTGSYLTYTGTSYSPTLTFSSISSGDLGEVYLTSSANSGSLGTYSGKVTLDLSHVGGAPWSPTITFPAFSTYTGTNLRLHGFVFDAAHTVTGYLMQTISFVASGGGGMSDADWAALYTGTIYPAVLSGGINSNLDTVTAANVGNFQNLFFEAIGSGKLILATGLDLRDSAVQDFLQHIPSYLEINDGFVSFNPTGSGADLNVNAQIYMYYSPSMSIPSTIDDDINNIVVRDLSGNILASSGMVSSFMCALSGSYNICGFTAPHFTSFEMRPWLTAVRITSSNTNTSYAKSGDVVTLNFTGSEVLSGIVVKVNGSTGGVTVTGGGTTRVATKTMGAGDGLITFSIDYYNLSGGSLNLSGATVTGTTNSSSVTLDNTAPTLTGAASVSVSNQYATFVFTGNEAGTVTYSGTCGNGSVTTSVSGSNSTVFSPGNNTYTGCQLKVTDAAGNASSWLTMPTFTINYTAPSGGGGGSIGNPVLEDDCPSGDTSPSRYDGLCSITPLPATSGSTSGSTYSVELNSAYLYAYDIGITTKKTIQEANMGGALTRSQMAKMMATYAIKVLDKSLNTGVVCAFTDVGKETAEMRGFIIYACQLGLMGISPDGTPNTKFNPSGTVTRAQFGTVLSRAFRGNLHDNPTIYYQDHLQALKDKGIISKTTPTLQEQRGYVMLMLMRSVGKR